MCVRGEKVGSVCLLSTCVHSLCSQSVNSVCDELEAMCQTAGIVLTVTMVSRQGEDLRIHLKTVKDVCTESCVLSILERTVIITSGRK